MRIAMLGSRGVPARGGGVERVVEELATELSARGHEVLVYCRRHYVASGQWENRPRGVKRIFTPGVAGKHLDTITHSLTAAVDITCRGADVIHIHSPGPGLVAPLANLAAPVVFTVHAADWQRPRWSPAAKAALRAGLSAAMSRAAAVICVNKTLAKKLESGYHKKVKYVPNAVRSLGSPPDAEYLSHWSLRPERYVLYAGRIVPEKRLYLLLNAWARAKRKLNASDGCPWRLVVAGEFCEKKYEQKCRNAAGEDVIFTGPQSYPVLAALYANAAMLAHPSVLEGMSLVLLEAASYGCCILAADIEENFAAMGESILYFRQDDLADLTDQLVRGLSNENLRKRTAQVAKTRTEEKFSWTAVADKMELIYRQVVRKRI